MNNQKIAETITEEVQINRAVNLQKIHLII